MIGVSTLREQGGVCSAQVWLVPGLIPGVGQVCWGSYFLRHSFTVQIDSDVKSPEVLKSL